MKLATGRWRREKCDDQLGTAGASYPSRPRRTRGAIASMSCCALWGLHLSNLYQRPLFRPGRGSRPSRTASVPAVLSSGLRALLIPCANRFCVPGRTRRRLRLGLGNCSLTLPLRRPIPYTCVVPTAGARCGGLRETGNVDPSKIEQWVKEHTYAKREGDGRLDTCTCPSR